MTEELKKLLDHVVEYATELLTETGESYPFAAYIDLKGNHHPLEMEINACFTSPFSFVLYVG